MTFGKYKRLLLVVTLPLLLVGFIASSAAVPKSEIAYRLCQAYGNSENCRSVGKPGDNFYDRTYAQSPKWFQVKSPEMDGAHDLYQVEGNARNVGRVTIDAVFSYFVPQYPQSAALMEKLKGRQGLLQMGILDGQTSIDTGSEIYLICHTLEFDMKASEQIPKPGRYAAICSGDAWAGRIFFTPSPEAEKQLVLLRETVKEDITEIEQRLLINRIVLTIAPLVLFLILSAAVWAIRRATAFVKAG